MAVGTHDQQAAVPGIGQRMTQHPAAMSCDFGSGFRPYVQAAKDGLKKDCPSKTPPDIFHYDLADKVRHGVLDPFLCPVLSRRVEPVVSHDGSRARRQNKNTICEFERLTQIVRHHQDGRRAG